VSRCYYSQSIAWIQCRPDRRTTKSESDRRDDDETNVRRAEVEATVLLVEARKDLTADMVEMRIGVGWVG
jgi:hypothetical protein